MRGNRVLSARDRTIVEVRFTTEERTVQSENRLGGPHRRRLLFRSWV